LVTDRGEFHSEGLQNIGNCSSDLVRLGGTLVRVEKSLKRVVGFLTVSFALIIGQSHSNFSKEYLSYIGIYSDEVGVAGIGVVGNCQKAFVGFFRTIFGFG